MRAFRWAVRAWRWKDHLPCDPRFRKPGIVRYVSPCRAQLHEGVSPDGMTLLRGCDGHAGQRRHCHSLEDGMEPEQDSGSPAEGQPPEQSDPEPQPSYPVIEMKTIVGSGHPVGEREG